MKIDLKDAFFSVPIDEELQRRFTFQWGTDRYAWTRLPQGWNWSSIFFHETMATILRGTGAINYADDIIISGVTLGDVLKVADSVFKILDEYGMKVNYKKTIWCTRRVKFLGFFLQEGEISVDEYLQKKREALGTIGSVHDLERAIGILSYSRRSVLEAGRILAPLYQTLKIIKKEGATDLEW